MTSVPEELLRSLSSPESSARYGWDCRTESFFEVKGYSCQRLRSQLLLAETELQLKGEKKKKLESVRDELESDINELTANLFEEANKMVIDANVKRMSAEKDLESAQAKIAQMQADVNALKTLFASYNRKTDSSESLGNASTSTQQPQQTAQQTPVIKKKFSLTRKTFRRKSHQRPSVELSSADVESVAAGNCSGSGGNGSGDTVAAASEFASLNDAEGLEEFISWKKSLELSAESPFVRRLIAEDVEPCLAFNNKEITALLLEDIVKNMLSVEPLHGEHEVRLCKLTNREVVCSHQIQLTANPIPLFVSQDVRDKIVTVCELFSYLGYIKQQLFKKHNDKKLFEDIRILRRNMVLQRLGFPLK